MPLTMSDDPPKRTHAVVVVVAIVVVDVARGRDQRESPGNRRNIQRVTYMRSIAAFALMCARQ